MKSLHITGSSRRTGADTSSTTKWSIPTPARSSHRRQHNAAADPAPYKRATLARGGRSRRCGGCYARALETARQQGSLAFELRTTHGVCKKAFAAFRPSAVLERMVGMRWTEVGC